MKFLKKIILSLFIVLFSTSTANAQFANSLWYKPYGGDYIKPVANANLGSLSDPIGDIYAGSLSISGMNMSSDLTITSTSTAALLVEKGDGTDIFKVDTSTPRIEASATMGTTGSFYAGGRYILGNSFNFSFPAFGGGPDAAQAFRRMGIWGGQSNRILFTNSAGLSADFSIGDTTHQTTSWMSSNNIVTERADAWHDGTKFNISSLTGGIKFNNYTGWTPSGDTSLAAGDAITPTKGIMRVVGNGGAVTLTSTPNITDLLDGDCVTIQGTSDTNTVTLQDESSLANSGLQMSGGVNFTLGQGDMWEGCYDSGDDNWYEKTRSDN